MDGAACSFRVANTHMTLLSLVTGLLWVCVTMIVAMWLGAAFEDRLMRSKTLDANLQGGAWRGSAARRSCSRRC